MATLQAQFGRIRRQANSKLTNQKQVFALDHDATAAHRFRRHLGSPIEETLREQDGQLTPPSYFATLLTLLEQQQGLNDGLHEPVLYLLAIVLPHTPTMILRSKFTTMLGILSSSIDLSQADAPVIRSVIKVLEVLLTALDANGWGQIIAQKAMQSILILATDPRPKVRKVAQEAATEILSRPPPVITQHPAAEAVATHCLDWLSDTKQHNPQALIHVLQLTKAVVPYWPINMLEKLCEPLLQLPKANNTYVTTS
ncbi:pre-rRNA processing protein, partial [Spiromyces aspiralis]